MLSVMDGVGWIGRNNKDFAYKFMLVVKVQTSP